MLVDLPTIESFAVTLIVTAIRTMIEASPTLVGGVVVAAYLRTQIEPATIQARFRGEGYSGILRAALLGMLLPVCSLGVLPVLRELRRQGLQTSKLLTVGIVAPLLNPFSLLYGFSLLSPLELMMIALATVGAAMAIGDVSSRFAIPIAVTSDDRPQGLTGQTRLRNLLIGSARLLTGQTLLDLTIVIGITAIVSAVLSPGSLYQISESGNAAGPAIAALISLPQYVSPSRAMIQFAGMGNANLSLATGLAIYVFGTAINPAGLFAVSRWYGARRQLALVLSLTFVIGALCYGAMILLPAPVGDVAETTALDAMARPASAKFALLNRALGESLSIFDPLVLISAAGLAALFVLGLVIRLAKIQFRNDDPIAVAEQNTGRMSKAIPASQLGAIAVAGLGVLFLLSIYIVFPAPSEVMDDISVIRLDASIAIRTGNANAALDRIAAWDSAAASIPIAAAIRGAFPTGEQRQATRQLRAELHQIRQSIVAKDFLAASEKLPAVEQLQAETKLIFTGGGS